MEGKNQHTQVKGTFRNKYFIFKFKIEDYGTYKSYLNFVIIVNMSYSFEKLINLFTRARMQINKIVRTFYMEKYIVLDFLIKYCKDY